MFASLVYHNDAVTGNGVNVDMTAALDANFSQRNNHYVFSERYKLLAWEGMGATISDLRMNIPSWNAITRDHCWPLNLSATPPSYRRLKDMRESAPTLPVNEEIALESSNSATATDAETSMIWIAPPNWTKKLNVQTNPNAPQIPGNGALTRLLIKATASYTGIAHQWSGLNPLTFEVTLRGGWYLVHHIWVLEATSRYFRVFFPRMPLYTGRSLRPGGFVAHAAGDIEDPIGLGYFGDWGAFHSFEPLTVETFADTANAASLTLKIDATYMGPDSPPPGYAQTGAFLQ